MNTYCTDQFNQSISKRRANPKADGGPDFYDYLRTGDLLFSGVTELNYRQRHGLILESYHQGGNDEHWITELLGNLAQHLGYNLVPALKEVASTTSKPNVKKLAAYLELRTKKLINRMDVACDALWDHGICQQNSAWLADDSDLFGITQEYNQIMKEAEALA